MGLTVVQKGNVLRIVESATAKSETVPIYKKGMPGEPGTDRALRAAAVVRADRDAARRARLRSARPPATSSVAGIAAHHHRLREPRARHDVARASTIDVPGGTTASTRSRSSTPTRRSSRRSSTRSSASRPAAAAAAAAPAAAATRGRQPAAAGRGAASDEVSGAVPSKLLVDERTNTLIVVSSEAASSASRRWSSGSISRSTSRAARRSTSTSSRTRSPRSSRRRSTTRSGPAEPAAGRRPRPARSPARRRRAGGAGGDLGASLEGQVRVIGDKPTNSLIVMSSGRDFLAIKDVIKQLDQPRRQVFIEALILEVQLSQGARLRYGSHGGLPIDGGNALVLGGVQTPTLKSLELGVARGADRPDRRPARLAARRLADVPRHEHPVVRGPVPGARDADNTNILSAPHIIAIDNEKTKFSVGNNIPYKARPVVRRLRPADAGAAGDRRRLDRSEHPAPEAEPELNVTPHISSNDAVRLEIEQDTKDSAARTRARPDVDRAQLKTQVVVHDQQTIVIGGLIQERDSTSSRRCRCSATSRCSATCSSTRRRRRRRPTC